jgi:hypothetical protein
MISGIVIPQNFLFAPWRKEIYAESDLVGREIPNGIPDQFSFAKGRRENRPE